MKYMKENKEIKDKKDFKKRIGRKMLMKQQL